MEPFYCRPTCASEAKSARLRLETAYLRVAVRHAAVPAGRFKAFACEIAPVGHVASFLLRALRLMGPRNVSGVRLSDPRSLHKAAEGLAVSVERP